LDRGFIKCCEIPVAIAGALDSDILGVLQFEAQVSGKMVI